MKVKGAGEVIYSLGSGGDGLFALIFARVLVCYLCFNSVYVETFQVYLDIPVNICPGAVFCAFALL